MNVEKHEDGWYAIDEHNPEYRLVGPYDTKADAADAARGLAKFYRDNPKYKAQGSKANSN